MPSPDSKNDPPERKPFRIQRKRLGSIRKIDPKGEFGFIDAEDFRDDVFFHRTVWQSNALQQWNTGPLSVELETQFVEFEIDDEVWATDKKLRAKVVRPTRRPEGRKMSGRDATFKIITHHPNARRKRPKWRGNS
ncbi:cold-shock protein [Stieleria varia]|uniref:Cold-shock DNA-binding domain protein n=1 Tax=Stieleria varia TaxID=2528005 RepID=A0A5C6B2Y5_9BACT|nr:cold shock domain-containing protein [Stieleria varia]TWU06250.1 Cold-shock DNA-binding domain protein [Stieleria varia]